MRAARGSAAVGLLALGVAALGGCGLIVGFGELEPPDAGTDAAADTTRPRDGQADGKHADSGHTDGKAKDGKAKDGGADTSRFDAGHADHQVDVGTPHPDAADARAGDAAPAADTGPTCEGCTGGTCTGDGGACKCPAGDTLCSGACINILHDPNNCSACGEPCPANESCVAGTCACTETTCGIACVDVQTDPDNCGGCARACVTGGSSPPCVAGRCSIVVLAEGQSSPEGIVVSASNVYWTNYTGGTVMSVALDGGTPATVAANQNSPAGIAIDKTSVYWVSEDSNTGDVAKASLVGGIVTTLVKPTAYATSIAVNATDVFWTETNTDTVSEVPLPGGTATVLHTGGSFASFAFLGIAANATDLYWTSANAIMSAPIGGAATTLAMAQHTPYGVTLDTSFVYWTNGDGSVVKESLGGSSSPTTLATGGGAARGIAVDATHVYWSTASTVMSVPLAGVPDGGGPVTLAVGTNIFGVAVDGTSVYWADYGTGNVMKVTPK